MANLLTVLIKETQFRIKHNAITTTIKMPRLLKSHIRRPNNLTKTERFISLEKPLETDQKIEKYLKKYIRENIRKEIVEAGAQKEVIVVEKIKNQRNTEKDLRNHFKIKVETAGLDLIRDRDTEEIKEIKNIKRETIPEIDREVIIEDNKDKRESKRQKYQK